MDVDVVAVHRCVVAGDLAGVRTALGSPDDFPNCLTPLAIGDLLVYAVYWGPQHLVRDLLMHGAEVNADSHDGFPLLIALMTTDRPDREELLALLLDAGADPNRHGVNDLTALHHAVAADDRQAVELLLAAGADPNRRTRIDDFVSPLEGAERRAAGGGPGPSVLPLLRAAAERRPPG